VENCKRFIAYLYIYCRHFIHCPHLPALQENFRNLDFHVCMWFAMDDPVLRFLWSMLFATCALLILSMIFIPVNSHGGMCLACLGYGYRRHLDELYLADPNNPPIIQRYAREPKSIGAAHCFAGSSDICLRDSIQCMDKGQNQLLVYNILPMRCVPSIWMWPGCYQAFTPDRVETSLQLQRYW